MNKNILKGSLLVLSTTFVLLISGCGDSNTESTPSPDITQVSSDSTQTPDTTQVSSDSSPKLEAPPIAPIVNR